MTDIQTGPEADQQTGNGAPSVDDRSSLLDQLRERHETIKTTHYFKDYDIPGYDGMLVARFVPNPISKTEKRAAAVRRRVREKDEGILLDTACDNLIDNCEQIMLRKSKGQEPVPIDDEIPVKFDSRLADLLRLGENVKGARAVVKELFPTEQSIIRMSAQLTEWLNDVTVDANEEFLGE